MLPTSSSTTGAVFAFAPQFLSFDNARLGTIGLLSLRLAATFAMTPVLYAVPLPMSVRVLLVLFLSVVLSSSLSSSLSSEVPFAQPASLLSAALAELALGATLGLGILLAFGAFSVAGQLLDVQLGFGIAQIVDPTTRRPAAILTVTFQYLAVLVFFLVDGHHALLRGMAYSIARFPVGARWSTAVAAPELLRSVGGLFSLGFALAAPVVFCILLVEFALGVVSRNLPQMNMFALGIPVKIVVGLLALSIWFTGIGGTMSRVYASIGSGWDAWFASAATAPAATGEAPSAGGPR